MAQTFPGTESISTASDSTSAVTDLENIPRLDVSIPEDVEDAVGVVVEEVEEN